MKKILFVLLVALLILSIFGSCGSSSISYAAPIDEIAIRANESLPLEYLLEVVYGFAYCDVYSGMYAVTHVGNTTIEVDIWNGTTHPGCRIDRYATQSISLGNLIAGVNYTIEVNDVTITFVAGIMIYLAPIHDIEVWAVNSSPSQYFVDVVSGETSICDHFDSYTVARAGNTTIILEILNVRYGMGCPEVYRYVENTIPLGSDFVAGGNYTVVVNDVVETFIAEYP